MEKRFFFDRIDIFGNKFAVHKAVQLAAAVFTHPAEAATSRFYSAVMVAEITTYLTIVAGIESCLLHDASPD
jgi:hypothetical protein